MFRNPRENATRNNSERILPAVGRAPSPPSPLGTTRPGLDPAPLPLASKMPAKTRSKPVAPKPAPSPAASKATKSTPKAAKGKGPEKGNGNIMAFFRKVAEANETLFVPDSGKNSSTSALPTMIRRGSSMQSVATEDMLGEEEDRFNESGVASKRRRLSPSPNVLLPVLEVQAEEKTRAVSDVSAKRTGPFIDDSDSEEDTTNSKTTDETEQSESLAQEAEDGNVTIKQEPQEDIDQDKQESDDIREEIAQEYPPTLSRQGTSYAEQDGFGDFEGMEDFDDEYAEGEEFSERRFAKEQRRLELMARGIDADVNDEDFQGDFELDSFEEDSPDAVAPNGIPACPICSSSLAGISGQDASVHVNNCLDGNPTPIPAPAAATKSEVKVKQEEQPPSAKFKRPVRAAKAGQESPFALSTTEGGSSAFSKLMSGNSEEVAWAAAAAAEHASRGKPAYTRTCPFYKIMPGFYICVDAFRYGAVQGCNAYFLSHFHSDHYIGLTSTWCHGPIYCSKVTANLVKQQLRVDPQYVIALDWEHKVEVPGTRGVFVTMIPANHCPGSSLFLFEKEIPNGVGPNAKIRTQRVLHCGDFRACPAHVEHPLLAPNVVDAVTGKTKQQKIDVCYLDTTYLNPKYAFPSQEDVIQACADMCVSLNKVRPDESDGWETMKRARAGAAMTKFVRKESKDEGDEAVPTTPAATSKKLDTFETDRGPLLVVVGTYSIGKERICLGIAKALGSKIWAPPGKQRICAALEDPEINARLTTDPFAAQVHMTPLFEIRPETLGDYLTTYSTHFTRCVGFRPSGWSYKPPGGRMLDNPQVSTVLYGDNWKSHYSMKDLVPQRGSTSKAASFGVPYSEHSSFAELSMFCCALRIDKIVPTVNIGSAATRAKMKAWIDRWAQHKAKEGLFEPLKQGEEPTGKSKEKGKWFGGKGTWELKTTL